MHTHDIQTALKHLRKDAHLKPLIEKYPEPSFGYKRRLSAFQALTRSIIFQQLSGKAAQTILHRFQAIYGGRFPTPDALLQTPDATLRVAGLSQQKRGYLSDLAMKFADGTIQPRRFPYMSDADIRDHIIAVKGVGVWTCDMFLMSTLGRPDVLPTGDLGIQNGFQKLFNMRTRPTPARMETLARPWQPYRSIACWYLWRLADEGNTNRPA